MKFHSLFLVVMTMAAQTNIAVRADDQLLYLASTPDKNIVAYEIDDDSGLLRQKFEVALPGNGGAMAFSPDGPGRQCRRRGHLPP